MKKLLVIEDDKDILALIKFNLSKEGFSVICAESAEDGLRKTRLDPPDLIILDLMLPGMDGLTFCRRLKKDQKYSNIPIIMLSAKANESDIVAGLELGADDYVAKPFSVKILIARIRTVLRRRDANDENIEVINVHGVRIDPLQFKVTVDDKEISLTKTEFDTLYFLARHSGRVYTRAQIIDFVKGENYPATDRAVDVQIVGLRKKLGRAGKFVETIHGIGYKFKE